MKKVSTIIIIVASLLVLYRDNLITVFKKEPVKVGFLADLTGRMSHVGNSGRRGFQIAIDEINSNGGINGRTIIPIFRDTENKEEKCIQETRHLIEEDVDIIIGPFLSSMAQPAINTSAGKSTLLLSATVSSDNLTGLDDNFLRIATEASTHGALIAETAFCRGDSSMVFVLDMKNKAFTEAVAKGFESVAKKHGMNILEILSFSDKSEIDSIAKVIIDLSPDGVVFASSGIDAAAISQQLAKNSYSTHLYGSMWTKVSNVNTYGGKSVENMVLIDSYRDSIVSKKEETFNSTLWTKHKQHSNFASKNSYDAVMFFAKAAKRIKNLEYETLKKEMLSIKNFQGLTDNYHLDEFGDVVREKSLFIIKNGKYEPIDFEKCGSECEKK